MITQSHNNVESAQMFSKQYEEKRAIKPQIDKPSIIHEWIIMDGVIDPDWVDNMNTLLDEGRQLALANGGHVKLHGELSTDVTVCTRTKMKCIT